MRDRDLVGRVRRKLAVGERARGLKSAMEQNRYARWRTAPVNPRSVLYESFSGNGMLDNPEAVFRYLLDQPDMQDLEHIWVLDDLQAHPTATEEFADHPRVRFVAKRSPEYLQALATSKYLFNNATFPQEFAKRPEQVYVNTWHGVPLKHMGFDMPNGGPISRNITRNFLQADYLVSANPYMTETMYRRAYRMQGIYRGAVIEEGQPRTDRQVATVADPGSGLALLEQRGVHVGGRSVVLYAPTWRGTSFHDPHVNAAQLLTTVRELRAELDPTKYVVLLKVHQAIYQAIRRRVGSVDFLVPNDVPTNVVLGLSDVLVTDYSSIFFDYVGTGRPIVHYVPDLEEYRGGRGLYLPEDELLGPLCETKDDLVTGVREALTSGGGSEQTRAGATTFAPKDDGAVCERIVNVVFRGHDESGYTVHRDFGTEKETLLIHLGAMKSMGITTSALNLLHNIDYDRYDVTAYYRWSTGRDRAKNIALVDPRVRVIPRAEVLLGSRRQLRRMEKRMTVTGLPEPLPKDHYDFWSTEWQRMFGSARFDHLIDFSGYGGYSPFLFSVVEAKHKSIWLHNDMAADMTRRVVGEKPLSFRLRAVFSTYRHFDSLVSVSPELNAVNQEKLAEYAGPEKFTYAVNTIDADRVLEMAGEVSGAGQPGRGGGLDAPVAEFATDNIASAMSTLLKHYDVADVLGEARSRQQMARAAIVDESAVTFVSIGRLSAEKNHTRLIKAFAKVHENHPHIRLVIMGQGDLEPDLRALIVSLGLESYVLLAGLVDNPYAIMADADCFVLSSDYEGQPMVILEARTLGLPVITTAFSSVSDSVPPDAGIVVPQTVEGVADGLERFLKGEVPASRLDHEGYNRRAMDQFYEAIHHGL
jgi:CDP-glycerol glycerophosphotransferase